MDPFGIVGILLSLAIAWWEHLKAKRAEHLLNESLNRLPGQLVGDIARLINRSTATEAGATELRDGQNNLIVKYADLNGDGKDEMIVEYISGPHSAALQVFGQRNHWNFGLLAELQGNTPHEYDLEDVDGDGVPEVTLIEVARDSGLPYVMGLRDRVSYKLTDKGFVEVKRVKCYTEDDLKEIMSEHNLGPGTTNA